MICRISGRIPDIEKAGYPAGYWISKIKGSGFGLDFSPALTLGRNFLLAPALRRKFSPALALGRISLWLRIF